MTNQNLLLLLQKAMNEKNPIVGNAMQMYQKNDIEGLRTLAQNVCESKGINIQDVQNRLSQFK